LVVFAAWASAPPLAAIRMVWRRKAGAVLAVSGCSPYPLYLTTGYPYFPGSEPALLEAIATVRKGQTTRDTDIGNVILSDFTPFTSPVPLTETLIFPTCRCLLRTSRPGIGS
jgi:hypothetical protein